uniref:Putative secreted protein n=1 Tax=Anopheles darlingi TaxID=43151 RepID=A0A2M4D244_ANODA
MRSALIASRRVSVLFAPSFLLPLGRQEVWISLKCLTRTLFGASRAILIPIPRSNVHLPAPPVTRYQYFSTHSGAFLSSRCMAVESSSEAVRCVWNEVEGSA